jgi:hypothetical protein
VVGGGGGLGRVYCLFVAGPPASNRSRPVADSITLPSHLNAAFKHTPASLLVNIVSTVAGQAGHHVNLQPTDSAAAAAA